MQCVVGSGGADTAPRAAQRPTSFPRGLCHALFGAGPLQQEHQRKTHACPYCVYKSTSKVDLNKHVRTHTGEKPYKCSLCVYMSADRSNLRRHMQGVHKLKAEEIEISPVSSDFGSPSFPSPSGGAMELVATPRQPQPAMPFPPAAAPVVAHHGDPFNFSHSILSSAVQPKHDNSRPRPSS